LAALAMLGHGSSVFPIIALVIVALIRGVPDWRWIGAGVAVAILLMAPWSAYQKYADPPGNRLNRWMLAGNDEIADESTLHAMFDAYREAGPGGVLHDKAENLIDLVGGGEAVEIGKLGVRETEAGRIGVGLDELRQILFFFLLPSLGLLLIAPVVMIARRRHVRDRDDWRFALIAWGTVAIGSAVWVLLLFGNEISRTVLHQGSFAIPILALAGCAAGLRAVYPRFANWYVSIAALAMLAVYVPAVTPEAGSAYSPAAILLAAIAAAGFAAVAFQPPRRPRRGLEVDAALGQ
jgi:hypothetical protein